VRVVLHAASPETVDALAAAGLQIDQVLGPAVIGRVAIDALASLAALPVVTRITLIEAS
jgi:hypothetical protein